jgi:hypothetical protein
MGQIDVHFHEDKFLNPDWPGSFFEIGWRNIAAQLRRVFRPGVPEFRDIAEVDMGIDDRKIRHVISL